jgi:hypothetical protein
MIVERTGEQLRFDSVYLIWIASQRGRVTRGGAVRMRNSGKLVIFGIIAVALASAAASWWFRFAATHEAARFWGPQLSQLIRDAPVVELCRFPQPTREIVPGDGAAELGSATCTDVSRARGLTHLRNALLEDRSFAWPVQTGSNSMGWYWALVFRQDKRGTGHILLFSENATRVAASSSDDVLSCQPISTGLLEMFREMSPEPPAR